MTLAWFAELAIKSSLICAATYLALYLLRGKSAGERSFIAHLGMAAIPLQSLAAEFLPFPMMSGSDWASGLSWLTETEAPLWFILPPAALLIGMTLFAVVRLFGLRNRSTVLVEPAWLGALAHAQRRMGFKSGAALLTSGDIASPVSWGLFRPTIVLDERALQAQDEAEAIIAHELAHVAGADWAKLLLSRIVTALYWFNPLVWLLARTCHELREEAADDAVLNHDVDDASYATILVKCARHECRGMLLAAHGVAPGKGSLRRRINRVLDTTRRRAPAGFGFTLSAIGGSCALILPLAAMTIQPPMRPVSPAKPVAPARAVANLGDGGHAYATVTPQSLTAPQTVRALVTDGKGHVVADAIVPVPPKGDAPAAKPRFSAGELIAMSSQGVTPEWLRGMAALGYTNLSGGEIAALASQGITPDYVRGLARAGYPRLSAGQLVAMKVQDVSPDYVYAITRAGGPRPSPDQLVALRVQGVSAELIRASVEAQVAAGLAQSEAVRALKAMKLKDYYVPPAPPSRRMAPPKAPAAPAPANNDDD
jgi:bla regulator protein blaR1